MQHGGVAVALALAACSGGGRQPVPEIVPISPARLWSAEALSDLRSAARGMPAHGLPEERAAIEELERLEPLSLREEGAAADVDEKATALFDRLALALATGAVDPAAVDPEWSIPRASPPDLTALRQSVFTGARPSALLNGLSPANADYAALVSELARLQAGGESSGQRRGDQVRVNLERWRWLPRGLPARRVEVIVPFFELRFRHDGDVTTRRVIVGARRTPTPTFSAAVESVTLNPTWTPPTSIASAELLPRFRRDPGAAAREGFEVLDHRGLAIDPSTVDWTARPFPYVLRQRPGAGNALGRVRFNMPNAYAVYLHDTPSRGLFQRSDRALSHGCIRVADPVDLAADIGLDRATLEQVIEGGETRTEPLLEPLPIFVLYFSAVSDDAGAVRYAEDIYGRDEAVLRALQRPQEPGARAGRLSEATPFARCASDSTPRR